MKKYYLPIIASIILLSACGGSGKNTEVTEEGDSKDNSVLEVTQEQFDAMKMQLSPLRNHEFDITVKASGRVDVPPQNRAKVASFIEGYIKSTKLLVGDRVTKGQALVTLENPEYINLQQSYLEVANQLAYLKAEYERQKTLFEENIASQKKYLEAESEYKKTKASYDELKKKLQMLNINPEKVEQGELVSTITVYAPISGEVTAINANIGMSVSPADAIVEIVDTKALHLELAVFEKDFFLLKEGQKVTFTIPQLTTSKLEANIWLIGKTVEKDSRVVTVYGSLADSVKQQLIAGMFIEAQIISDSKTALSVPYDAVIAEESNSFLLVLQANENGILTFRKTLVKTGARNGDWVEIVTPNSKLSDNSTILIKGVYDVM